MAHRLLHTLVFSSMFMLHGIGCAKSTTRDEPDAGAEDMVDAHMAHMVDAGAPVVMDAGDVRVDAFVPAAPDAGAPDASDPRFCEPGWPTTKGQWMAEIDGELWGCEGHGGGAADAAAIDLSECCRIREEG